MPNYGSGEYVANLEIRPTDFGPECTICINGNHVASLEDYYSDGTYRPIFYDVLYKDPSKGTSIIIEVYRFWKGEDRLVYTRGARISEGNNMVFVSYNGVKVSKHSRSLFGRIKGIDSWSNDEAAKE